MKIALARLFVLVGLVALLLGFADTGTAWGQAPDPVGGGTTHGEKLTKEQVKALLEHLEKKTLCICIWILVDDSKDHTGGSKYQSLTDKDKKDLQKIVDAINKIWGDAKIGFTLDADNDIKRISADDVIDENGDTDVDNADNVTTIVSRIVGGAQSVNSASISSSCST